jgi:hypothetical protein
MSDQDPFVSEQAPNPDPLATLLAGIKNETGEQKYKTPEDAIKALAASQAHIKTLEQEREAQRVEAEKLREVAKKVESIDEVIQRLTANNERSVAEKETPSAGGLSADAVAEIVKRELAAKESNLQAQTNAQIVQKALTDKFGDKTKEMVAKKAAEIGSSPEQLGKLAIENPSLVLALFNTAPKQSVQPTTPNVIIPPINGNEQLERPTKSLLLGASSKDQMEYMQKIKAHVYKQYDVTT